MSEYEQNEAVSTENVEISATEQVAEVEPEVTIPEPEIKEPEVVAEQPKIVVTPPVITPQGTVVETQFRNLPGTERQYRLVKEPPMYPRGRQRALTLELLRKYAPIGSDKSMSAKEVYKEADAMGYQATAATVDSIAWHLNQMLIQQQVVCVSGRVGISVERKVTPAEALATKPLPLEELIARGLVILTDEQRAMMQLK